MPPWSIGGFYISANRRARRPGGRRPRARPQALSAVEPDRLVVAEGSGLIRFDVAAIQAVADAVKRAVPVLDAASAVGGMGETHVAQLTEAVGVAREKLVPLAGELTEVASLLGVLPGLLGVSGERVYGVLAQNNVEIRSTGGLAGQCCRVAARASSMCAWCSASIRLLH